MFDLPNHKTREGSGIVPAPRFVKSPFSFHKCRSQDTKNSIEKGVEPAFHKVEPLRIKPTLLSLNSRITPNYRCVDLDKTFSIFYGPAVKLIRSARQHCRETPKRLNGLPHLLSLWIHLARKAAWTLLWLLTRRPQKTSCHCCFAVYQQLHWIWDELEQRNQ